jgi:hypothetical protein
MSADVGFNDYPRVVSLSSRHSGVITFQRRDFPFLIHHKFRIFDHQPEEKATTMVTSRHSALIPVTH